MSCDKFMSSSEIGEAIKRRRQQLSLSQEELAARLDVSYQQIQRYESGKNKLNVENIQLVADALSVSVNYFFPAKSNKNEEAQEALQCSKEQELLVQFRKIQDDHLKEMVVNLSRLAAKGEGEES